MSRTLFAPRGNYRHWATILTRWNDNDVYGHVNNAIHYQWFDTVVNTWLIDNGLLDIVAGDPIGLVVETGCRFASSITHPQQVEIGLVVDHLGSSSVTYRLGLFAIGGETAAAEGTFTHVYVERGSRRPVLLPEAWRTKLETITVVS